MIQAYQGVAAICNLCQVPGPIIRADLNRFNRMGPDDLYTQQIQRKAKAIAEQEGFITVEKYAPAPALGPGARVPAQVMELHICPACSGQIKGRKRSRKLKPSKETEE